MAHGHSYKKITIAQAEKQGFTVDTHCYPHFGYRGSRFRPDESVGVLTKFEAELIHALQLAYEAMNYMGDILNNHDIATDEDVNKTTDAFTTARNLLEAVKLLQ